MKLSSESIQRLRTILDNDGIRAVLQFLNGLTGHRFTALYRFDDEMLKNLYFFDRTQPDVQSCPDIPVLGSYCVFVRSSRQTFVTPNSLEDERVAGHPKRLEVRSYCGVPLVDDDGHAFGTICHFDFEPMSISNDNIALMEALAQLVQPKRFSS